MQLARVIRRRHRNDRGAAAVEFALIAPLFFALLFGIIELGVTLNEHQAVEAAAREGARVLALPSTSDAEACARVTDALDGVLSPGQFSVSADGGGCSSTQPCATKEPGDSVTVRITATRPNWILPGSQHIDVQAVFRCEL
jgi:Flp pilus assembly protein TadG